MSIFHVLDPWLSVAVDGPMCSHHVVGAGMHFDRKTWC